MQLSLATLQLLSDGGLEIDGALWDYYYADMTWSPIKYSAFYDGRLDEIQLRPIENRASSTDTKPKPKEKETTMTTTNKTTNGTNTNHEPVETKSKGKGLEPILDLVNANLQLVRQAILAVKHWMRFSKKS